MDVAIIADDLTGAADSAMEFTAPGRLVQVALGEPSGNGVDVLAVDADSREALPSEAARRVGATVTSLALHAPKIWYKKLDSTLRGNVAAELVAFADAVGCSLLLVAPSFPAQGRSYIDGALHFDEQTTDRRGTEAHLPALLEGAGRTPEVLSLRMVQRGPEVVSARLRSAPLGALVIADAVSDRDLDCIVGASAASGRRIAYAGSAGLAAALGRVHGAQIRDAPSLAGPARVFLIVGSQHPTTRRQVAVAVDTVGPLFVWPCDPTSQPDEPNWPDRGWAFGCRAVVTLATPATTADDPRRLASRFASLAATIITEQHMRRVFCTGGEVARAVCDQLGIRRFSVEGRVQEGMPALRAYDGRPGLMMVTKAGGFGGDDSLLRAYAYLAGGEQVQ